MKVRLLVLLMLLSMGLSAETMRVAILEPVDRENRISYSIKLILRANLAKAITSASGYEAYDRSDMDAIMGEQNFQRTGMVSEDQIKRLGEMTGAKYILVSEVAIVDEANMFITAKVLDVETAKTEMTDNYLMGTSANAIQYGCEELAAKLFNVKIAHSVAPSSSQLGQTTQSSTPTHSVSTTAHNQSTCVDCATIFLYRAQGSKNAFLEINGKEYGLISEAPGCTKLLTQQEQVDLVAYVGRGDLETVKVKGKRISITAFPQKGDILCYFVFETMGKVSFFQVEGASKTLVISKLEKQSKVINIDQ